MTLTRADLRAAAESAIALGGANWREFFPPAEAGAVVRFRDFIAISSPRNVLALLDEADAARWNVEQRENELKIARAEADAAAQRVRALETELEEMRGEVGDYMTRVMILKGAGDDLNAALNPLLTLDPREVAKRRKHWEKMNEGLAAAASAYRAKVRDEAIEECARVADNWSITLSGRRAKWAMNVAADIRALASASPAEDGKL